MLGLNVEIQLSLSMDVHGHIAWLPFDESEAPDCGQVLVGDSSLVAAGCGDDGCEKQQSDRDASSQVPHPLLHRCTADQS